MHVLMSALHPEGGIRTFFRYIYGHPVFAGDVFTLVAPDNGLSAYLDRFVPGRVRVIAAEPDKLRLALQIRAIARRQTFDLIHSHGFSAGLLTELARTGLRSPHLMTGHDVFMDRQFAGISGYMRHLFLSQLFQRMTAIHTVGKDARANLLAYFPAVPGARVHGILNGVDTRYFRDALPQQLKLRIGLNEQVPLIGFFGRFMGQKGFRLLVDSIDLIVKQKLIDPAPHVATFGWNGFIREDYEYLNQMGLRDYFHQLEQTNETASMIKAVDLVVMPSRWEACPLLPMEVLAAGVPIIGSDCIGLREVLAGSPAITFPTGDAGALTDLLVSEIALLPERRQDFAGYQAEAVARFDYDRTAQALARLYVELTDSGES